MPPGSSITHYRIVSRLGEGGMGVVYRATDTKLNRDVAIKVLPDSFAGDPGRMARFEREAQVLASLNHPNIAAIYGVEQGAIVMELVVGENLKGPVPIDAAMDYARQIAAGLEAAHEKGIVHRDLKPANIRITADGIVKLLDFGLARAAEPSASEPAALPTVSPTLSMGMTQPGMILGTTAYMAPEQALGKPVDKRADIWAFGVVLYEMLTGQRLFAGETVSDTLAAVLTKEPDLAAVPWKVRRLIGRCLEKDPKKRLRDIGDYAGFLDEANGAAAVKQIALMPSVVAAAAAVAALALAAWISLRPAALPEVTRFQIFAPPGSTLPPGTPAPSPDGRMLAYTMRGPDGVTRIYVRSMDTMETRALPDTEGAIHPFWSADGHSLAFAAANALKRLDVGGGSARTLTSLSGPWHGAWNRSGIILFQSGGLVAISADGGAATPVQKLDAAKGETSCGFPFFLSDNKRFLTLVTHSDGSRSIELETLGSMERKLVLSGIFSAPILAFTPDRRTFLLYYREGSLMAQDFDEKAGTVRGSPFLLVDRIGLLASPPLRPSVGVSGRVLAYQTASDADGQPAWFDRSGKLLKELSAAAVGRAPVLSPDGRLLAITKRSGNGSDIWLVDLSRESSTRLTFGSGGKNYGRPIWAPDGKRLAYQLQFSGVYVKDVSGIGPEEQLPNIRGIPLSWSPDGQTILFLSGSSLFLLPLGGNKAPVPVGPAKSVGISGGRISPDGKYFAFPSTETGRTEVYVEAMPPATGKWQISVNGGTEPQWRRDGKELFFVSPDSKIMAADIQTGQGIVAGVPHALFQTAIFSGLGRYDVSADGQRFLIDSGRFASADAPITVVLNWWAGLIRVER